MDHVLKALDKAGYEAVSTLRFGADKYDSDLVQERLRTIGIAVAILLVMMAAEILILRSIFKIQIKDQKILKFMGMSTKLIGKINYMEMRRYSITAIIVVAVVMNVVGIFVRRCVLCSTIMNGRVPSVLYVQLCGCDGDGSSV